MKRFFGLSAAYFLFGCASQDNVASLTGPAPVCAVHKETMHPEWISISPGEIVYMGGYATEVKTEFPNHGGEFYSGERQYRLEFVRRVRDYVCSSCDQIYRARLKRLCASEVRNGMRSQEQTEEGKQAVNGNPH